MDKENSLENLSLICQILGPGGGYSRIKIDLVSSDSIQDAQHFVGECLTNFLKIPENISIICGPICLKVRLIYDDFAVKYTPSFRKLSPELFEQLIQTFGQPFKDYLLPTSDFIPEKHVALTRISPEKIARSVSKGRARP